MLIIKAILMDTIIEKYTYAGLIDYAENRKKHKNCKEDDSRSGRYDFCQSDSFEEAVKWGREGWDLGLEEYKIEDGCSRPDAV